MADKSNPAGGDARQARRLINHQVENGERSHPNRLPCKHCGQRWREGLPRHEYHHHLGYGSVNHGAVISLCIPCHKRSHHG